MPPTVSSEIRTVGWPVPTGHLLAVLAAEAALHREVVADRVDPGQHVDAVADQRRAAHRRGHLAVLDQVALRDPEHEVAGRGLDLPAGERDRVQAALDVGDDVLAGRVSSGAM